MGLESFTSNNGWFDLTYPSHWTQFEEEDGTYLFMDNDNWKGNLRITAFRFEDPSGQLQDEKVKKYLNEEMNDVKGSKLIRIGNMDAVHYTQEIEQDDDTFLMNYWYTGTRGTLLICSFTVTKKWLTPMM